MVLQRSKMTNDNWKIGPITQSVKAKQNSEQAKGTRLNKRRRDVYLEFTDVRIHVPAHRHELAFDQEKP